MDRHFYISGLIAKKNKGTISISEEKELNDWVNETPEHKIIAEKAEDNKTLIEKLEVYQLFNKDEVRGNLETALFKTKTVQLYPKSLLRYAAVLVPLIMLVGISWYILTLPNSQNLSQLDKTILPGSQKATLVLSDGNKVDLEDQTISSEMKQGDTQIKNQLKSLTYSADDSVIPMDSAVKEQQPLIFNELITPLGGNYKVQLADGTTVMLNAGSSLRYPVSFSDSVRKVYLKGQAYFDVSHNGKPFIVSNKSMDVRVLGTSFDISAYPDDSNIKTTLVEGKVLVSSNLNMESSILQPNDQAILSKNNAPLEVVKVETSQYTSWTKGKIEFDQTNLEVVMRRLARWYDFKYRFENESAKNYHFTARLDNDQSISSILEMLEMTTKVKFEIKDDNTIAIL